MVKKRIIANFFNNSARDKAREKVQQRAETDSFIIGEIEENEIPDLQKQQGIIIEPLDDSRRIVETPGKVRGLSSGELVTSTQIPESAPTPLVDQNNPNIYIIQFKGPLLDEWRKQLDDLGVTLIESIPYYNFTARLTPDQINPIRALTFVDDVHLYDETDTGLMTVISSFQPSTANGDELKMITYDGILHRKEDLQNVLNWLQSHAVNVAAASGKKIRFNLIENSSLLQEIRRLPEISMIQEFVPSEFHNDLSRILLGIDSAGTSTTGSNLTPNISETGEDQIIAIADSGIHDAHPDFKGRIVGITSWGRRDRNDHSDPIGHGTHVAGSVLGDGSSSGGKIRGTAPKAKLFFQSLIDDKGQLFLPVNLADLFDEAYKANARISSNSYGANTMSVYYITSLEIDDFVANHRDMLIVRSAGNDGTAQNPLNSKKGYVDWLSIGSPATCKNGMTVGASRTSRKDGAYKDSVWGTWQDAKHHSLFPDPPIASEKVSGNPECMAAFSSRGPTDDHRVKPDVVAPGTDILSTRSPIAPGDHFWGLYSENENYAYMGGTSMSTPLVAGCAALVREYYTKTRNHNPSAALLKATIINSTRWLSGQDSAADHNKLPNFHQGFGFVYMPQAIPNKANPNFKLEFIDSWNENNRKFSKVGQMFNFQLSKSDSSPLRLCMAYTDPPGRALQNNLNLQLGHKESGQMWMGNENAPLSLKIPDPDNNVEVIRLENPLPGTYNIFVQAKNLLSMPQDFALVVTGEGISLLTQM